MGGWNPIKDIIDIIDDIVDGITDIIEDVISWLVPMPDIPDFGEMYADQTAKGVLVNKFSANAYIPIIYGTRKVGGNVVFLETSGADNQYLYMVIVLGEGEIDGIDALFINDQQVTLSGALADNVQRTVDSSDVNFYADGQSLITVEPHFGTDTQETSFLISSGLVGAGGGSWSSNHRLRGLAYLALRFEWNSDKFGSLPSVQAIVRGRKVYDPRLDSTVGGSGSHRQNDSSTWAYSDNPIIQLLDYLRNDRFGMGIINSCLHTLQTSIVCRCIKSREEQDFG